MNAVASWIAYLTMDHARCDALLRRAHASSQITGVSASAGGAMTALLPFVLFIAVPVFAAIVVWRDTKPDGWGMQMRYLMPFFACCGVLIFVSQTGEIGIYVRACSDARAGMPIQSGPYVAAQTWAALEALCAIAGVLCGVGMIRSAGKFAVAQASTYRNPRTLLDRVYAPVGRLYSEDTLGAVAVLCGGIMIVVAVSFAVAAVFTIR